MVDFSLARLRDDLRRSLPSGEELSQQIDRALKLADLAHRGQFREQREGNAPAVPYITHPVGVAKLAAQFYPEVELSDSFDDVLSVALMHDVLEDTDVDLQRIAETTNRRCADLVLALTKPPKGKGTNSEQRNAALLAQIMRAGTTARFVKLCDAIHNISRPQMMPLSLLRKTLQKATRDYLPLSDDPAFGMILRPSYEKAIVTAESVLERDSRQPLPKAVASLDEAIGLSIERSRSKVLEEHDLVDVIKEIAGPAECTLEPISTFVDRHMGDKSGPRRSALIDALMRGEVRRDTEPFMALSFELPDVERIIAAPLGHPGDPETKYLILVLQGGGRQWLSKLGLSALLTILGERLMGRRSRESAELAETIKHYGLDLDPSEAQRHTLDLTQIQSLKELVEAGNHASSELQRLLAAQIDRLGLSAQVDRMEGRVKAPTSILVKMRSRKLRSASEIDDLVGFRVIFVSPVPRDKFRDHMVGALEDVGGEWGRALRVVQSSVDARVVTSSSGYRGTHVLFAVEETRGVSRIPCEVQLRTIQEDAWARISQVIQYKLRQDDRTERVLRRLAELRDEGDRLLSEVRR